MLRDKLQVMSNSLVLSQNRAKELEERERTALKKWMEKEEALGKTGMWLTSNIIGVS
jgi:hypothetical protein